MKIAGVDRYQATAFRCMMSGPIFVILHSNKYMMYQKKTIPALVSLLTLMFFIGSCSLDVKTIEPYLIQVDSIAAPDTVNPKAVFEIRLYGIVGPNSCFTLEKVYCFVNEQKEITLEARGNYRYEGIACTEGVILLDTKVETNVPTSGIYTIKVLKQDNTYLEQMLVAR